MTELLRTGIRFSWRENLTFDIQEIQGQENKTTSSSLPNIFSKLKMKPVEPTTQPSENQDKQISQENDVIKKLQDDILLINQKFDNMMSILEKLSERIN